MGREDVCDVSYRVLELRDCESIAFNYKLTTPGEMDSGKSCCNSQLLQ